MSLRVWVRVDDDELRRWCVALLLDRGHVVDVFDVFDVFDDGVAGNADVVVCDSAHVGDNVGVDRVVVVVDAADDVARRAALAAGAAEVVERRQGDSALIDVLERTPAHATAALDDVLAELRRSFEGEIPKRVRAIRAPLDVLAGAVVDGADRDAARDQAVRAAHVLYGSAGSFGFSVLSAVCRDIELTLRGQAEKQEATTTAQAQALLAALAPWPA